MMFALALAAQTLPAAAPPPLPPQSTCDQPVYMVIAGPTHDRARMMAYGKAIADSKAIKEGSELRRRKLNVHSPAAITKAIVQNNIGTSSKRSVATPVAIAIATKTRGW